MQITFIIPCYNAENIIIKNYEKLISFIKKYQIKSKIIYINDGSIDNTYKRLKEIKNNNVQILNNNRNLGKSKSIINAIKKVKTNYIVLIDCDLPYFMYLQKIIKYLKNYDLVVVNRKLKKSANIDKNQNFYKITRNLISNFLGKLIENKLRLNVNGDTQAGLKAFKINKNFKKIKFFSKYYFFDIELISYFRKKKLKIKLVPVKFKISNKSSIRLFSFKNYQIIIEFFKILKIINT
tara:strand:+ start:151 stop:861 length:711 start_codon:yes stop_codon:yes gene_type:complete